MATRTIIAGGGNYNATGTWVEGIVPTSADDVVCLAGGLSGQLTVNVASAAKTIDFTNYTNTITFNNTLTVSGNVTLVAAMSFAGASALVIAAASTMTSNGKTLPQPLTLSGTSVIYTLADNWTISGTMTTGSNTVTINGNTLNCGGSLTMGISNGIVSGTTNIVMTGTGTISMPSVTTGTFRNNLEINTAGTTTFSGTIRYQSGIVKYTAGTVTPGASTFVLAAASTITANASGLIFGTLSVIGGSQAFNGTSGFTMATFSCLIIGLTFTLTNGNTYSITSSIVVTATAASHTVFAASAGTVSINYSGSTMALAYCDFTNTTATGTALYTYQGTLTGTTTNITTGTVIGSGSGGGTTNVFNIME